MQVILEKYTGTKPYVFPDGKLADKNGVLERYPTALSVTWLAHTDEGGEMLWYLYLLSSFRSVYNVPSSLNETQAIQYIEDKMNEVPREPESDIYGRITALENVCDALEQTLQILIEETVTDKNRRAEITDIFEIVKSIQKDE